MRGTIETFAYSEQILTSRRSIYNLGTFSELYQEDDCYIVTKWNVETGEIKNYVFKASLVGTSWPLLHLEDVTRQQGLDLFYDTTGRLITIQQRLEKRRLSLQYTRHDQISQITLISPDQKPLVLARYEYDNQKHLIATYDALGYGERYRYDDNHRLLEERRKNGGIFTFQFDPKGRCIRSVGQGGYDEKRLKFFDLMGYTEVIDSRGIVTQYHWLPTGQVTREIDPLGRIKQTQSFRTYCSLSLGD